MSTGSYLSIIERYQEYRQAIRGLMASILDGIAQECRLHDKTTRYQAIETLGETYPFLKRLYRLDEAGMQSGNDFPLGRNHPTPYDDAATDHSQRPYFTLARTNQGVVVTEPYFSPADGTLCITASLHRISATTGEEEYLVLEINLAATVAFLMGDMSRRRFQPFFKSVYIAIVTGLFFVVAILLFFAAHELWALMDHTDLNALHLKPFSVIVFLTLGLAVFDLGKTTLEEEVLMHKDIFRHSSTRRTITRFIAAILIAVSIEALLLMFKAALGDGAELTSAVSMMVAAVGLLVGLGIYVFLGAHAEAVLLQQRQKRLG